MKDEDKPRFSALLFWLAKRMKAQGGKPQEIDPDLIADWFIALQKIRIERLEWGARHLFATEKWFPMPVDLEAAAMKAPSSVIPFADRQAAQHLLPDSFVSREEGKRRLAEMVTRLYGVDDLADRLAV